MEHLERNAQPTSTPTCPGCGVNLGESQRGDDAGVAARERLTTRMLASAHEPTLDAVRSVSLKAIAATEQAFGAQIDRLGAQLTVVVAENASLIARRDELLALVARIAQSTPLDSEVAEALTQRAALLAEVGTLRARLAELERMRDAGDDYRAEHLR